VLQRAISTGAVIYEKAADLIAKLKADSLDSHVILPPATTPPAPHDSHGSFPGPALPGPPAPPTTPVFPPGPRPFVPQPDLGPDATRRRQGRLMTLVIVGAVLLVVVVGVIAMVSGWTKKDPTPPPADNNSIANNALPLTDNPDTPAIDPRKLPQLTEETNNNANEAFKKLREAIANGKNNPNGKINPNYLQPIPTPRRNLAEEADHLVNPHPNPLLNTTPQGQVRVTLVDDLGNNQASEDIAIYVNGQALTGSKTRLHIDHDTPHDTLVIVCNNPGVYTISAKATTVFYGGPNGTFRSNGTGTSGPMNIRGGETLHFNIQNFTAQDYSSYTFAITAQ